MACVALASLIGTIEIEFVQPTPRVRLSLHHRLLITSIIEKLSCLRAFLQKKNKSIGDGDAVRDLEIEIKDFALKAEDDIEFQLSNIILLSSAEYPEKAASSYEHEPEDEHELLLLLYQTLEEAAKNATELLESCLSEREMGSVALTILIKKIEQHFQMVYYERISFLQKLSSLQACLLLQEGNFNFSNSNSGTAIKKIRIFALKVEDGLEIQLSNFLLTKHNQHKRVEAFQELRQTLREAVESAEELLNIIEKEEINLSSLQVFMGFVGAAMKYLETKTKDFALKAKYGIQVWLNIFLRVKDTVEYEDKVSQELHHTMQEAAESAAELLNIINEEVDDDEANETQPLKQYVVSKSANVVESDHGDGSSSSSSSSSPSSSSHGFLKLKHRMVGRHHDCTVIKDRLFLSPYKVPYIISIVGMMGIGKTTVSRNVYEDPSVASHFDVRGWVTIPPPPQHYNKSRMLSQLLQSIKPEEPKKGSTPDELQMQVRECLRGSKYLIVLDNIMSDQPLTDITQCVLDDIAGSFILLTTRHFKCGYAHRMTLLDPNESWELFCNILSIEEHLAPKFEKIRNQVVEKCDGLPQLIVEVAKRLSKCNNIQQGWKKIEKELESLGILDRNALMVSYNPLPYHLKVCFLYFRVFPKRYKILVKMLIRLWIAEGFVKPMEPKELEDQAYEYLQDLIDGSLLLIEDRSCNGEIKTCRMHSAMHSFCVVEAQKEGILCAVNTQQHSGLSLKAFANSCRWLSLYSHSFDYYVLFGTNIPRSIFFFHDNPEMFVPPKPLRVLAFDTSISLQRVPVQLDGLMFLRYLSISQWFKNLDDVMSNNPNLETLVVSSSGASTIHLPSSVWKPPNLRHLQLGNSYMVDPPSAYLKNLQTLSWVVRPLHCKMEVYRKFPKIKNLKILLKDDIAPGHIGGCCSNPIILDHFDYFKCLEKLSISVSIGSNAALPELARFPSGLKKLKLSGTNISERDLNVISMLPKLMVLKLENGFHGTVWEVAKGGFCELRFLLLEAKELKQWVVSWNHFMMLRHLVLRSFNCLEQMPKDFTGYILETIELEGCHSSLVASAKQFQQKRGLPNLKIKSLDPKYDESQNTHTKV